jgi:hypothetical protein
MASEEAQASHNQNRVPMPTCNLHPSAAGPCDFQLSRKCGVERLTSGAVPLLEMAGH